MPSARTDLIRPLEVLRRYPPHQHTIIDVLRSRASVQPDKEALLFQGRSYSYAELVDAVQRCAAVLRARGVGAGDRVGVMSFNHPTSVFLLLALASLGAIYVPVNPDYGVPEAHYVLNHAQVSGVVAAPGALATVRSALEGMQSQPWLVLNEASPADAASGLADLPGLMAQADPLAAHEGTASSTCIFIYTSGTTGFPKGVMHSQRSLVIAGEGFVARMFLQPDDRVLCVLPMFHINAIFYSLSGSLAAGATLILEPRFSASSFWKTVHDTRATEVNTIAAASAILMRRPRSEFVGGHALQKIYGAPFDREIYRVFHTEFDVPVLIEGYGMSEIPGALNNPFDGEKKIGAMGPPSRHPDPAVKLADVKIVDDQGHELPVGQTGELVVRTPIVMQGYYRDEAQTEASFRDGWFLTGDLAWKDGDGYLWFVARKKDIIRKRGENISGAELDRVIGNHPSVLQAAAIPTPSELGEDDILVAVQLQDGHSATHEEIADWCRQHLAPIKVPRYIVFVDALPLTPTNRIAKFKMRDDASLRTRAVDLGPSGRIGGQPT
jgi:carnitine-CoA ligase